MIVTFTELINPAAQGFNLLKSTISGYKIKITILKINPANIENRILVIKNIQRTRYTIPKRMNAGESENGIFKYPK